MKQVIKIITGPLLFAIICISLNSVSFNANNMHIAIGLVVWMSYWWVTRAVDLAVTAFLPIILNSIFEMTAMSSVISNYASETIILLFGSSILSVSMENTGLDRRIAATFLKVIGDNLRKQLIFWFVVSSIMSAFLPNVVVCATLTPIAFSMLKFAGEADIAKSSIGSKILLYIAYGVGIGGLATPLGGVMNLVTVDYLQQVTGAEYFYTSWVLRFLPFVAVLLISNIIYMLRDVKKSDSLSGSKEYFSKECESMGKMTKAEKLSLVLFAAATVLSFARSAYQALLPGLKPAYIFLICALLSFLIKNNDGSYVNKWNGVQKKISWELIFVFAGGLALGTLINNTGAAQALGDFARNSGLNGGFIMILVILAMTIILSDITSNTATAAVSIPIVISICSGLEINPIPWIYVATIGVNISYTLPTSIRAIPVGYGLEPKYMFKEGWKLSLIVIGLMSVIAYLLLMYVPFFSEV